MTDYEKMTVKELVEELTSLGVTFNKKSRKAELIELLKTETEGKSLKSDEVKAAPESPVKPDPADKKPPKAARDEKVESEEAAPKSKTGKKVSADSGYAIVRTGGKQYQVSSGSRIRVEKITGEVGDTIELQDVLAVFDGDTAKIGQPKVDGAVVTARIIEQDKAKKVTVFKKKRRKGYRVKRGHRQMYTALEIADITV